MSSGSEVEGPRGGPTGLELAADRGDGGSS